MVGRNEKPVVTKPLDLAKPIRLQGFVTSDTPLSNVKRVETQCQLFCGTGPRGGSPS